MKYIISILLAVIMLIGSQTTSTYADDRVALNPFDFSLDIEREDLEKGVSVILTRSLDGQYCQTISTEEIRSIISELREKYGGERNTADGYLEWAVFHLGLQDWVGSSGSLYYYLHADEPLLYASGTVYVKSTSFLFPNTYYQGYFSRPLYGMFNDMQVLNNSVDLGDETSVRVGFSNILLETTGGQVANMSSGSTVVYK